MTRSARALMLLTLFVVPFVAAGCGGSEAESGGSTGEAAPEAATDVTITPVGNQMTYEQTEITVPAGEEVTLTFENTATSAAMKHNVVVLTTSEDAVVQRVGQAGMKAASSEYVPDDEAVLAATGLADPGETVTVTFEAPSEPGAYTYVCTYPGHYASMQGTMRVVES
jgi:azurin